MDACWTDAGSIAADVGNTSMPRSLPEVVWMTGTSHAEEIEVIDSRARRRVASVWSICSKVYVCLCRRSRAKSWKTSEMYWISGNWLFTFGYAAFFRRKSFSPLFTPSVAQSLGNAHHPLRCIRHEEPTLLGSDKRIEFAWLMETWRGHSWYSLLQEVEDRDNNAELNPEPFLNRVSRIARPKYVSLIWVLLNRSAQQWVDIMSTVQKDFSKECAW
ncbi:4583_t:CDS:2 [Acaulospora colombiana]|uniref:4583_t:CDS:1 n=1 Tax=Acaulospora colombiana TaxID=27376 RepID=A0ACA9NIW1_9GLOM|nr:4583_t:CDS:2 [Acaulospora colombiana]